MNWTDDGLVIGLRAHGESAALVELMTRAHGRHLGLVHGARSRRLAPVLQPGNRVQAAWRARLDEQLGTYTVEPEISRAAALIASPLALAGLAALAAALRLLPERDPHPALFETAELLADHLADASAAPALFVRFELVLLAELGFGLDLSACAATGATVDLAYVSPKSGRAVGRLPGEPWRDRLLPLPAFLAEPGEAAPAAAELAAGFRLTAHFLEAHAGGERYVREGGERARFVALATGRPSASARIGDGGAPESARTGPEGERS
ncbi:MAG: DNA repair protein RecO [Methylobacteriaceae bacterium]|nr:DNA repair protein RecO [Methylobacteriaceae bacterium]